MLNLKISVSFPVKYNVSIFKHVFFNGFYYKRNKKRNVFLGEISEECQCLIAAGRLRSGRGDGDKETGL